MISKDMKIIIPAKNLLHYQKNGEISTRICMIHDASFSGSILTIEQDKWVWVSRDGIAFTEEQTDRIGAYYPIHRFWDKNQHFYLKAWEFFFQSANDSQMKFDPDFYIGKIEDWYDRVLSQTEEFALANHDRYEYEPNI